jgi:NAD+ synthase
MSITSEVGVDLQLDDDELEAVREHIVRFIRERAEAAGADRAVLGLSGGIDSTLTAYLAVEALGAEGVHGLVMPGDPNVSENMSDAERVAEDLGVEYDVIGVEPIADAYLEQLPGVEPGERPVEEPLRTAVGNVRVRIRAVINYFVANREGALVLGTGNRSEALVGYFTKYGDGAVDCHPIGILYKQQVRQLASHLGVPEDIVTKTPTAGLWAGQTDEDELGVDYDTLDAILALTVDGPFPPSAAVRLLSGVTEEQVEWVHDLHQRSEHKRRVPPAPEPLW